MMKKIVFILVIWTITGLSAHAQLLRGIGNMVKNKAVEKATGEAEKRIGKILNGKKERQPGPESEPPVQNGQVSAQAQTTSYSKYDFVQGENVIYFDDFSQSAIGELPIGWNASGKGEVVKVDGEDGKWLRLFPGSSYLSGNSKPFGENYTIEFDVLMNGTPPSGTRFLPNFILGMISTGKQQTTHNSFLKSSTVINNKLEVLIKPNVDKISTVAMESSGPNKLNTFSTGVINMPDFNETLGRTVHYAIQVQKQRFRMWIDGKKIFDTPRAINISPALNQFMFKPAEYWMYNENNYGLYLSNFRVATGNPNVGTKLSLSESFSTSGIRFQTGSSEILPESYGILREIGQALSDNGDLRFRVTGHTDNLGDQKINLKLSEKRAEAVVAYLVNNFKTNIKHLEIKGKGSMVPLADNNSQEGRAQNRRVEFTKL